MTGTPATPNATLTTSAADGIRITRVFDAPRELVFAAWTTPEHFAVWFGGPDANVPAGTVSMDVRPGGAWRATMFAGEHEIHWHGVFREVDPPARLALTLSDQPGDAGDDGEPITVDLRDLGGRTEMTFHQPGGYLDAAQTEAAGQGWSSFFDHLAKHLARA